jgi:uncharacterized coiled-coil protein SlyX
VADNSLTADDVGPGAVAASELADGSVAIVELDATNGAGPDQVLGHDGGGQFTWVTPSTAVTTDGTTLTGNGAGTALRVADEGVGTTQLADGSIAAVDIDAGNQTDGHALIYDATVGGSNLVWRDPAASTSSRRFKTDVTTIEDAGALLERLRGVRFHWTADGRPDVGLIAEEVAAVLPELVTYEADGTTVRGLRYAPLVGVLIEAAKAQQAALDAATETLASQRRALADQKAAVAALTERMARLEALLEADAR